MDIRKVKKLIDMVAESGIAEIEIHEGEESIRISRHTAAPPPFVMPMPGAAIPPAFAAPSIARPGGANRCVSRGRCGR